MIELTLGAQQRLDSYFAELRRVLVDDGKADPVDVERDIRDHIQTALADADGPVDESRLDQVLRSLGAPAEWIDHPDRPWFARPSKENTDATPPSAAEMLRRVSGGREGYLLPSLSLLILVSGLMLALFSGDTGAGLAIVVVAVLGAFVLARAAIARQPNEWQSPVQKWLLSPSLLMMYVPLLIAIITWPLVPGIFLLRHSYVTTQSRVADASQRLAILNEQKIQAEYNARHIPSIEGEVRAIPSDFYDADIAHLRQEIDQSEATWIWDVMPGLVVAGVGTLIWWVTLYIAGKRMTETIRTVFAPYSPQFVRRGMLGIASVTFLVALLLLA